jgi:Cu/Ag efflux protein CusF
MENDTSFWKTLAVTSALTLGLAASAYAEETTGKVTAIDVAALTVTLDDGQTYDFGLPECRADASCALATFNVGDQVTVTWDTIQGKRMGQQISPVHQ